jgi:hypothetical protein
MVGCAEDRLGKRAHAILNRRPHHMTARAWSSPSAVIPHPSYTMVPDSSGSFLNPALVSGGAIILVLPGNATGMFSSLVGALSTLLTGATQPAMVPAAGLPNDDAATTPTATTPTAITPEGARPHASTASEVSPRAARSRSRSTPATKAQAVFEARGDVSLDRRTWVKETGVSRRLLDRAIRAGVLPVTRDGVGRKNRRNLVKASDMASVLATVEAVRDGKAPAPNWFESIIRP